jgi:hypothetical protein
MTDNALAYRHGSSWKLVLQHWGLRQTFIGRTAHGPMAGWSASSEPCRPSGPTTGPGPVTSNAAGVCHAGWSTTTRPEPTPRCTAGLRSADNDLVGRYT